MPQFDLDRGLARENLCRFLAACYYQPGPEFAEEHVFDSMHDAATRVDPDLAVAARQLGEAFVAQAVDDLLVDYARLFLGPNTVLARPYGSAWLEGEKIAMGESTVAVQELYREAGFEIGEEFHELPDHVAAELEFLYLLIHLENDAHRNGRHEALEDVHNLRRRFLGAHLGRWIGPFAAVVNSSAQSNYFRTLADLTHRFVALEAARPEVK